MELVIADDLEGRPHIWCQLSFLAQFLFKAHPDSSCHLENMYAQ